MIINSFGHTLLNMASCPPSKHFDDNILQHLFLTRPYNNPLFLV